MVDINKIQKTLDKLTDIIRDIKIAENCISDYNRQEAKYLEHERNLSVLRTIELREVRRKRARARTSVNNNWTLYSTYLDKLGR